MSEGGKLACEASSPHRQTAHDAAATPPFLTLLLALCSDPEVMGPTAGAPFTMCMIATVEERPSDRRGSICLTGDLALLGAR